MNLSDLRKEINKIDSGILDLLFKRQKIIPKVIEYKIKHNLVIYQPDREKELLNRLCAIGKEKNLRPEYIKKIYRLIMAESKITQGEILKSTQNTLDQINFKKLKLHKKKLHFKLPIFEIFKSVYANFENFFFLESLGKEDELSRYSYIGFDPCVTFQARGNTLFINGKKYKTHNPFETLKKLIPHNLFKKRGFYGGLVGYFGYESLRYIEDLPYFKDNKEFYDFEFGLFLDGLIHNKYTNEIEYFYLDTDRSRKISEILDTPVDLIPFSSKQKSTSFSKPQFKKAVKDIKKHINLGNVYQSVISNRYEFFIDGASLAFYEKLRDINPSPFMYFMKFNDREILGASPELVTRVKNEKIETFPIAGTRKRGKTKSQDEKLAKELINNEKERAEHMMLVDMGRNDLGCVCEFNSVHVDELMSVKKYSHVQHIVSKVSGKLKPNIHLLDAVMTNMPMGTVSGAPRIEAIRILNELEPVPRGPYSGAAGYMALNNECMFTLMIRSLFIKGHKAYGQAGAGIVYDSVPEYEYKEVEKKMGCIKAAMGID